ncbi:MAG: ubiquinol-cytochrome c reductase cytochrome b subunit [Streptosporangiales bacterium]|nr:ubiquinol-cytochrome c reductase cytochrome b subunit [Streptosporangiales bacterium]
MKGPSIQIYRMNGPFIVVAICHVPPSRFVISVTGRGARDRRGDARGRGRCPRGGAGSHPDGTVAGMIQTAMRAARRRPAVSGRQAGGRRGGGRGTHLGHWTFMFGEIAAYSFAVLAVTGFFLLVFYEPSMERTGYHGSYATLRGVSMSEAYASTLRISFDVRGGLLIRQIHHWAALIFVAAVTLQLLRMFFTGAFRRPRTRNWQIWILLLILGMAAGVTGTILPDDMLSGGSLALIQGVTQSIPVVGSYVTLWLFGGEIPGQAIIFRMYWVHLIVSMVMVILFVIRYRLLRRYGHSQFGSPRPAELPVRVGAVRTGVVASFLTTCGVLALLGAVAQINPIWLYGPYQPGSISAGSVPGWYMGFLDGALRIMPSWEFVVGGHTVTPAVFIPALVIPGGFFLLLATYPAFERWATGDRQLHHVLDRPRNTATRTALGVAGVTFYGVLWAAAANDQIASNFHVSLFAVTGFFRLAVLAGPPIAFVLTQRICLGLQRRDLRTALRGVETGIVRRLPDGGYLEDVQPPAEPLPAGPLGPGDGPDREASGRLQAAARRFYRVDLARVPQADLARVRQADLARDDHPTARPMPPTGEK